jgi:hypothetical protein
VRGRGEERLEEVMVQEIEEKNGTTTLTAFKGKERNKNKCHACAQEH